MASLIERAGEAALGATRTVVCGGGGFVLDNLPAVGPAGRAARELARGIHGAICGLPTPPELGEGVPPPFSGGQCQGVLYQVTVFYTKSSQGATEFNVSCGGASFIGPIQGATIFLSPTTPGAGAILIQHNGTQTACATVFGGGQFDDATIVRLEPVRVDGQPDNCGNPPISPPPPAPPIPIPPDIDLPVTPPGGGPDVDFNFSPRVGPVFIGVGGGLFIPVNVRINGPNINVNAPISVPVNISLPDFNISFPGQGNGGGEPDNPSAPVPPGPPPRPIPGPPRPICCDPRPEPGEDEPVDSPGPGPTPPPGRRLLGLIVRSSIQAGNQSATEIGQGGGEQNLFVPRIANVYFEVAAENSSGQSVSSSTAAIPVQVLRQYVPAPESVNVSSWRVVVEPGVSAIVTPLYTQTNRR